MARELGDVNRQREDLQEHIVVTDPSLPEWGLPRLPSVPACLIVYHADDRYAKLKTYARCLTRDRDPWPITTRDLVRGRQPFKGRTV
jgi:hypothetical protein